MPPFRELAPQPIVSASSTATLAPRRASVIAAESPVNPAPTTATSTLSGKGRKDGFGICTVSSQNVFSWNANASFLNAGGVQCLAFTLATLDGRNPHQNSQCGPNTQRDPFIARKVAWNRR